jgi:hypothetical protein
LRLCLLVALLVVLIGPSGVGAYAGVPCPGCQPLPPLSPDEARAGAAKARSNWLHEISRRGERGRAHPHPVHFRSPSRATFVARLKSASRRYRFDVLRVHFYEPLQLAPFVIVRSARPKRFSRDTFAIVRLLDPVKRGSSLATAWAYEGFYLEARDAKGVPFLAAFSFVRGGIAGGQWARSEELYPFPHG